MGKIRHIAYRVADVEGMAKFFVDALGMTVTQKRRNQAIDLSDGTINITVLPLRIPGPNGQQAQGGIDHIGFTVEDESEAGRRLEAAGAKKIGTIELGSPAHYEVKYQGPEGVVIDLGHWLGTAPVGEEQAAATSPQEKSKSAQTPT